MVHFVIDFILGYTSYISTEIIIDFSISRKTNYEEGQAMNISMKIYTY